MAMNQPCFPRLVVLGSEDLLGKIMLRLGSSKHIFCWSAVSPHWRAVVKGAPFRRLFGERHEAASVGFLVEMQEGTARTVKLLYGQQAQESVVAIRCRIDTAVLAGNNIHSSRDGLILTYRDDVGYYTSKPGDIPRVYTTMAPKIPRVPLDPVQHTINTFGQFGVVPNAGSSGMSFFVKDASKNFIYCYDGVSFCSSKDIYYHVCIYDAEVGWERFVSDPFNSPEVALFHRNPYSVLIGKKLYMMYVVDYVVCLDLLSKTLTKIALPSEVRETISSWYEYTIASHCGGGLVLVHYCKAKLFTWVLRFVDDEANWILETALDLIEAFGSRISLFSWRKMLDREGYPIGSDNFFSLQVRTSTANGRFVFITLGFELGMFEVDMINSTVREIGNVVRSGLLGRIYALSEPWTVNP